MERSLYLLVRPQDLFLPFRLLQSGKRSQFLFSEVIYQMLTAHGAFGLNQFHLWKRRRVVRDTVTDCRAFSEICDLTQQYFVFIMSFVSKLPSSAREGHVGCLCALVTCRTFLLLGKRTRIWRFSLSSVCLSSFKSFFQFLRAYLLLLQWNNRWGYHPHRDLALVFSSSTESI